MDIGQPTTTTEARVLTGMVQYYRDMCTRRSHVVDPLMEAARVPKCRSILWNNEMEVALCELKRMVSADTILNYPEWKIIFTVQSCSSPR